MPIVDNPLFLRAQNFVFPDPSEADDDGLVAVGGDLHPARLIAAYKNGIFPWFIDRGYVFWYSPDPRLVLFPDEFKLSRSLAKTVKNKIFEIRFNSSFEDVMRSCAAVREQSDEGSWITEEFVRSYTQLHDYGLAMSVEAWQDDELVGGLYGVRLGRVFFGESMFFTKRDASKVALWTLCNQSDRLGIELIDCQQSTPHLTSLGAREISRDEFVKLIMQKTVSHG